MQKTKKMLTGSVLALIIVFFMVFYTDSHKMLVYGENLDETAVTVDGEALSLEDIEEGLGRIARFVAALE